MSGRIPGNSGNAVNRLALNTTPKDKFNTPERKQQQPITLQSQMKKDPFSQDLSQLKKSSKPSTVNTPSGGKTFPGMQTPNVGGFGTSTGGVDTFGDMSKQSHLRKNPHEVGTQKHGSPQTLQYQTAHGEFTHTQGNGKTGLSHQQANVSGGLIDVTHKKTTQAGPVEVKSEMDLALLKGKAEAGYRLNLDKKNPQLIVHGEGSGLSGVQGSVEMNVGNQHVKGSGKVEGSAGVTGKVSGDLVLDPKHGNLYVQGGYEGAVGATGKASGKGQIGPFVFGGHVGGQAGFQSSGGAGFGMKDGVIGGGVDLGGAVGGGFTAGVNAGIDMKYLGFFKDVPEPKLTRMGNITPAGAMHADQSVRNHPEPQGPKLTRMGNIERQPQGVNLAA